MGKKSKSKDKITDVYSNELQKEINEMREYNTTRKRSFYRTDEADDFVAEIQYDAEKEIQELRDEEKLKAEKQKKDEKNNSFSIFNNMSVEEMESHYSHCIKLCSDNKVNAKNAFKLQLIDYMKLILSKKMIETDNLPLMSCTLDASAKIYSYRVDKVYSDMVNIISKKALSKDIPDEEGGKKSKRMPEKKNHSDSGSSEDENAESEDFEARLKKILGTHESFDRGKIEAENYEKTLPLQLEYFNELPLSSSNFQLKWEKPLIDLQNHEPSEKVLTTLCCPPENFQVEDFGQSIPGYENLFEKYTVEGADEVPKNSHSSYTYFPNVESNSAMHLDEEDDQDTTVAKINGDIDGGLDFEDFFDVTTPMEQPPSQRDEETGKQEEVKKTKKSNRLSIKTLTNLVSASASDYSFFDESKFAFWKKPDHWQLKQSRMGGGMQRKNLKLKNKNQSFALQNGEVQAQINKLSLIVTKLLAEKTIRSWCEQKHTSPLEILNAKEQISCCFKCLKSVLKRGFGNEDANSIAVDFDTSMKFTPEDFLGGKDDGQEDEDDVQGDAVSHHSDNDEAEVMMNGGDNFWDNEQAEGNNLGDGTLADSVPALDPEAEATQMDISLIPVPYKVNKIPITFAKRQKRIDIKLVKETMWSLIGNDPTSQVDENQPSCSKSISETEKVKTFTEMLTLLHQKLPEETNQDLSFGIAFMSLLHLANEKNLSLKGNGTFNEVFIETES